ncbi:MAG: hypothetical protein NTZ85_07075, partial [Bacteroidia bacterium]|nr:hypothetical protein [Bacteroidia bacterium]
TALDLKIDENVNGYIEKTTPQDTDLVPLQDLNASGNPLKKLTWGNTKTTLIIVLLENFLKC